MKSETILKPSKSVFADTMKKTCKISSHMIIVSKQIHDEICDTRKKSKTEKLNTIYATLNDLYGQRLKVEQMIRLLNAVESNMHSTHPLRLRTEFIETIKTLDEILLNLNMNIGRFRLRRMICAKGLSQIPYTGSV